MFNTHFFHAGTCNDVTQNIFFQWAIKTTRPFTFAIFSSNHFRQPERSNELNNWSRHFTAYLLSVPKEILLQTEAKK